MVLVGRVAVLVRNGRVRLEFGGLHRRGLMVLLVLLPPRGRGRQETLRCSSNRGLRRPLVLVLRRDRPLRRRVNVPPPLPQRLLVFPLPLPLPSPSPSPYVGLGGEALSQGNDAPPTTLTVLLPLQLFGDVLKAAATYRNPSGK